MFESIRNDIVFVLKSLISQTYIRTLDLCKYQNDFDRKITSQSYIHTYILLRFPIAGLLELHSNCCTASICNIIYIHILTPSWVAYKEAMLQIHRPFLSVL